jgi:hypothetical protein
MPVDPDWYREALNRKEAVGACEACGKTVDWVIEVNRGLLPAFADEVDPDAIPPGPGFGLEVVRVSCPNCGLVRLFKAETLLG